MIHFKKIFKNKKKIHRYQIVVTFRGWIFTAKKNVREGNPWWSSG